MILLTLLFTQNTSGYQEGKPVTNALAAVQLQPNYHQIDSKKLHKPLTLAMDQENVGKC